MPTARQQLDNLADALVEDVMAMSDEEILAEMREDGEDPEQVAAQMRELFERAVEQANRRIHVVDFRQLLGNIERQDITVRELRRLLMANRKTGLELSGRPEEIAQYINCLKALP